MKIIPEDKLVVMQEEDLVDKLLRGREDTLGMQEFSENAEELAAGFTVMFGNPIELEFLLAAQIMPCQFPDSKTGSQEGGYIAHIVAYDMDAFSMLDRPVLAIAAHTKDIADIIESEEGRDHIEAMYETLRHITRAEAKKPKLN